MRFDVIFNGDGCICEVQRVVFKHQGQMSFDTSVRTSFDGDRGSVKIPYTGSLCHAAEKTDIGSVPVRVMIDGFNCDIGALDRDFAGTQIDRTTGDVDSSGPVVRAGNSCIG